MAGKKARKSGDAGSGIQKDVVLKSDEPEGKEATVVSSSGGDISKFANDSKVSALINGVSNINLRKDLQAPPEREMSKATASTPTVEETNDISNINCAVCARIGETLPCCEISPNNCKSCSKFDTWFASQAPDPKNERQIKEDCIESLKLETKQFEAENERLKEILAEKRKALQEKRDQLYGIKPEGPKTLKKMGRAKAQRKKEMERSGLLPTQWNS